QHAGLVNPLAMAPGMEFELGERVGVAGRAGVTVHALPRSADDPSGVGWGAAGADSYSLVADLERGVLLRLEARLAAAPFAVIEFAEMAFDEPLDPRLFEFAAE